MAQVALQFSECHQFTMDQSRSLVGRAKLSLIRFLVGLGHNLSCNSSSAFLINLFTFQSVCSSDDAIPSMLEPVENNKALRKNWARLIQKIYEVDPLVCPKCKGTMRIISFIEDVQVIRDILTHLGIWLFRSRPPPKIHHAITLWESKAADSYAHSPHPNADAYADPEYAWDDYIQS